MFGLNHWQVEPDIIQFAKAITSGYIPLGGIGVHDKIAESMDAAAPDKKWMHAYTYSAHPVCCAVALANLDIIEREDFPAQAAEKGKRLLSGLETLASHPNVGDVRGLGLMTAVEIVKDKNTKEEFTPSEQVGMRIHDACQQKGLFSRLRGDVFILAPPVVTTEQQLDQCVNVLGESIRTVLGD